MATQIFDSNHAVQFPSSAHPDSSAVKPPKRFDGGALRGFFFAMLFNVFLLLICAGAWEIWHALR